MARRFSDDSMFDQDGRPRCEDCAAHESSAEGRATDRLLTLVYQLAGVGRSTEDEIPDELQLRGTYYAAYHEREHLSYAELGLEDTAGA